MHVEVVAALHQAEGGIKRQWLIDAVEISCVSSYPSNVRLTSVLRSLPSKEIILFLFYVENCVFLFFFFCRLFFLLASSLVSAANTWRFSL